MDISRNSWHFRVLQCFDFYPRTLCTYFWSLVFCLVVMPAVLLVFGVVIALPLYWWLLPPNPDLFFVACVIGFAEILILLGVLYTVVTDRRYVEGCAGHEPNIVTEYLAAKKQKVCPIIRYTE